MRNTWLIARRELGAYLKAPMGYVIAAIVLFIDGLWFSSDYVAGGPPKFSAQVLQAYFAIAVFMTMAAGVLIAMRLFAEEKQLGTLTLLLTSPIREREIVAGKFLSAFIFASGITVATLYMPLLILVNGKVGIGHIAGAYFGLLLVGGLALAVGMFASAISPNQIIAAVGGTAIMVVIYWCFKGASVTEPPIRDILAYISIHKHQSWQHGILNTRDIFYYLSTTYLFLLMTTHALQARRWR
jgi:ABC-2 type transport system permease protein